MMGRAPPIPGIVRPLFLLPQAAATFFGVAEAQGLAGTGGTSGGLQVAVRSTDGGGRCGGGMRRRDAGWQPRSRDCCPCAATVTDYYCGSPLYHHPIPFALLLTCDMRLF